VQEDGHTALMLACESCHTDIVKLLLAKPRLNVNAAKVGCADAMICHFYARCEPEVRQEGWVRGRVMLEVDCVGGGL
jgi:hypothetical protein